MPAAAPHTHTGVTAGPRRPPAAVGAKTTGVGWQPACRRMWAAARGQEHWHRANQRQRWWRAGRPMATQLHVSLKPAEVCFVTTVREGHRGDLQSRSSTQVTAAAGGSSPRTWQRRPQRKTGAQLAQGARYGAEAPHGVGHSASWGTWVPCSGCFITSGKQEACQPVQPQQR